MYFREGESVLVIRLKDGEDFVESVKKVFSEARIDSAAIVSCIGMWRDIEFGVDYKKERGYKKLCQKQPVELISVQGNIGYAEDGELILHAHACVAREDGSVLGGHLLKAVANTTNEVFLLKTKGVKIVRREEKETGLGGMLLQ
jgi:predicted DNA-binding protein with PD1-like motif